MDSTSSNNRLELTTEDIRVPAIPAEILAGACEAFWKQEGFEIVETAAGLRRGERRSEGRVSWFKAGAARGESETILKLSVGCEFFGKDDVGSLATALNETRHRCLRFVNARVDGAHPRPKVSTSFASSSLSISELDLGWGGKDSRSDTDSNP